MWTVEYNLFVYEEEMKRMPGEGGDTFYSEGSTGNNHNSFPSLYTPHLEEKKHFFTKNTYTCLHDTFLATLINSDRSTVLCIHCRLIKDLEDFFHFFHITYKS